MIKTQDEFDSLIDELLKAPYVAVDTETTGQDCRDGRGWLMGLSVATETTAEYLPFRHTEGENLLKEWISTLQFVFPRLKCIIFHNAKFDIVSLGTIGIEVSDRFYDTMLMAHMIDENIPSKSLEFLGNKFVGEGKARDDFFKKYLKLEGWANIPTEVMEPYAKQDAALTLKLFHKLYPKFKEQKFEDLWPTEQQFIRLLIAMESNGIRVDVGLCSREAATGRDKMEDCAALLGFNPGSTKQLGQYLINELKLPVVKKTQGPTLL